MEIDLKLASMDCGQQIGQNHLAELGDRIQAMPGGKFVLPKFIHFQYGELSEDCAPHKAVFKAVRSNGLVKKGQKYVYPSATLALGLTNPIGQDKDKEKDKEKTEGVSGETKTTEAGASVGATSQNARFRKPTFEELQLLGAEAGLPDIEVQKFWNHYESNGWKVGKNPMKSLGGSLGNWKIGYEERTRNNGGKSSRNSGVCPRPAGQASLADVVRRKQEKTLAGKVDSNAGQSSATPVTGELAMGLLQGLRKAAE